MDRRRCRGARLGRFRDQQTVRCVAPKSAPENRRDLDLPDQANRAALLDVQLSAPNDVSVLAMVGVDERIREAFTESVKTAPSEMERFAAVPERRGEAAGRANAGRREMSAA